MRRRRITRAYTGKPSALVAVALLGALAFFHFKNQGRFDNVDLERPVEVIKNIELLEKPKAAPAVIEDPSYAITTKNIVAYNSTSLNKSKVGVIEANTELTVLDVKRDGTDNIIWARVRSNGLAVWLPAGSLKFN